MNSPTLNASVARAIREKQSTQSESASKLGDVLRQLVLDAEAAMGESIPIKSVVSTLPPPKQQTKPVQSDDWPDPPPPPKPPPPVMSYHEVDDNPEPPEPAKLDESAVTPLEYLLRIMNDPAQPAKRRDKAALMALPYLHKKQVATAAQPATLPGMPGLNPKTKTGQRAIVAQTSHVGTPWGDVLDESGHLIGNAGEPAEGDDA